ncbi:cyclopropane-fatty-acyl-phospholipid synthase family protein [Nocardioides sp. SYSU D00038]|uniref:SAM-dependent methyltransferase n=1 Tax=Nocardioides sp. SYSU D00038 TaxID=2812554 RepID=UPI001966D79D|nr:class I SAM-dependent methyltransferase [Nocardioides sp. SYSU D00038]
MSSQHPDHDHQHDHQHGHQRGRDVEEVDLDAMFTQEFWDERYAGSDRVWSGRPNQRLVEQVEDLEPGTAIDVGCGEGADAVWLARRGWTVTGVDVSQVAVDRAARHAAEEDVADRATFARVDVVAGDGLPGTADLVTASFVHVPPAVFDEVYRALAAAVRPGGRLLVLAHHPDDEHTGQRNPQLTQLLFGPEAVTRLLGEEWEVEVAAAQRREARNVEGDVVDFTDTVVRARRRQG